jgi:GxxExxY protein
MTDDPSQPHVKSEYPLSDVTARLIAVAKEVHHRLGPGFEEVFYQRAMALELPTQALEGSREAWIDAHYKGQRLGRKRVDFVIEGAMVEIKRLAN